MSAEEKIKNEIVSKFKLQPETVKVTAPRRIFLSVENEIFNDVLTYAKDKLGFRFLCTIIGLDDRDKFLVMYNMAHDNGIMFNLQRALPHDKPEMQTITPIFKNAEIYERELVDLFGIDVKGLPPGNRYPLPDDWPSGQHPLRKDWTPANLDKQE